MANVRDVTSVLAPRLMAHLGILAMCALVWSAASTTARALDIVNQRKAVFTTSAGCFWINAEIRGNGFGVGEAGGGDTLSVNGMAYEANTCSSGTYSTINNPAGNLALRWTLWKWNGSDSEVCASSRNTWKFSTSTSSNYVTMNTSAGTYHVTPACDDGFYNVGVEACLFKSGAWRCETQFSGWMWADVRPYVIPI